jgi:5-hydroxyisourate hydrolase-like protein (transthyretin family)
MKMSKMALVFVVYISMISTACAQVGKVTVVVKDYETGEPLSGVNVSAGFENYDRGGAGPEIVSECTTGSEGRCSMWAHGNGRSAAVAVRTSPEYYGASEMIRFKESFNPIATPWNPTIELRLKQKRNPIPMYAKKLSHGRLPEELRLAGIDREKNEFIETPAETLTVAWDLEKGDWVKPHGRGEAADFIFTIHRMERKKYVSEYGGKHMTSGATVEISFSNQGDGLIPYPVPEKDRDRGPWMPYEAPEDGYGPIEPKINIENEGRDHDKLNFVKDMNYFFRVRTIKDQTGKIISAHYGKIHGDFIFGSWGDYIDYTYYFNPTPNDRNVEFKPGSNLFTALKGTQDPYNP